MKTLCRALPQVSNLRPWILVGVFLGALPLAKAEFTLTGDTNPGADDAFWASGGSSSREVRIAYTSDGSLSVDSGSQLESSNSDIGYGIGKSGSVLLDGAMSSWDVSGQFRAGYWGDGIVRVSNGGSLSSFDGYIAFESEGSGDVTITGLNSSWNNTGNLHVGYKSDGVLTISNGANVTASNADVGFYSIGSGIVDVVGEGSSWHTTGGLGIGDSGNGVVQVRANGSMEVGGTTRIGVGTISDGRLVIEGAGAKAILNSFTVGDRGTGRAEIGSGGALESSVAYIGDSFSGNGVVEVLGSSTNWSSTGAITVGRSGRGELVISDGASVVSSSGYVGTQFGSLGIVRLSGAGSSWSVTNLFLSNNADIEIKDAAVLSGGDFFLGYDSGYNSVLKVDGVGARLSASGDIYVGSDGTASLDVGGYAVVEAGGDVVVESAGGAGLINIQVSGNGMLKAGEDGSGSFVNNGTVNLFAYGNLAAGTYAPITVGDNSGGFSGTGTYNAFGGTWDNVNHIFTVATAQTVGAGGVAAQDVSGSRLALVDNTVQASFGSGAGTISFNAQALTVDPISEQAVVGAFGFTTDLAEGETVLLSFNIGEGFNAETLSIWHREDGSSPWTLHETDTFSYADGWASFTVTGFSDYAITVVPEPATYALLIGLVGLGMGTVRRRQ